MADNPMAINNIRAAGTQEPGRKQEKQPTKAQAGKRSKMDLLLERVTKLESALMQLSQVLQQHEQQNRVGALERHVCLYLLEQEKGRETIESLMAERAELFGLQISFDDKEKVEDDQNDTDEPDSSDPVVSESQEYESSENYTE